MKCPNCGHDKFPLNQNNTKWDGDSKCQVRYRRCPVCGYGEKTIEPVIGPQEKPGQSDRACMGS